MERIDLNAMQEALGIRAPWTIGSFSFDEDSSSITLKLEQRDKKGLLARFDSSKKDIDGIDGRWAYQNIGTYRCFVEAKVPVTLGDTALNSSVLALPAFLGASTRNYSNYLRQQVLLAQIKGLTPKQIAWSFNIPDTMVAAIVQDAGSASSYARALAYLPTEIDPVWDKILTDQMLIKTNALPLKLLLSKLKLNCSKLASARERIDSVMELRKFFLSNAQMLDNEIDQVCGIQSSRNEVKSHQAKAQQKLVLPAAKNPVWLHLLSGKLRLNSHSVPLNLLISRQRSAFLLSKSTDGKLQTIEVLRDYFRKNYRNLRSELLLLNRAMEIRQRVEPSLPDAEHGIWQKILSDDRTIPSNHVAYKLLLAKLRGQISMRQDPVVKLEAARQLRHFVKQNSKSMSRELSLILQEQKRVG